MDNDTFNSLLSETKQLRAKLHSNDPPPADEMQRQADLVLSKMQQSILELIFAGIHVSFLETSLFYHWFRIISMNHGISADDFDKQSGNMADLMQPLTVLLKDIADKLKHDGPLELKALGSNIEKMKAAFHSMKNEIPKKKEEVHRQVDKINRALFGLAGSLLKEETHPLIIQNTFFYYWLRTSITNANVDEEIFQKLELHWPDVVKKVDVFFGEWKQSHFSSDLTAKQLKIVSGIDRKINQIIETGSDDEAIDAAILTITYDYMDDFKFLIDTLKPGEMDDYVGKYYGFYRFAKLLDRMAEGISNGAIEVPKDN